jgi:hypothetical protein
MKMSLELCLGEREVSAPEDYLRKRVVSSSSSGSFSSCGTDSGLECSEVEDSIVLDESLGKRIVAQVEAYLSDDNLAKDAFLFKHIKKSKEGYINVKLFGSLRKVKNICKDWKIVAAAIKVYSQQLIMNDEGTKVRRVIPFTVQKELNSQPSTDPKKRKVLLVNLSSKKSSVAEVADLFPRPVRSVEIIGDNASYVFEKQWFTAVPELRESSSVIVEFESEKEAIEAVKHLDSEARLNWRQTMKAYLFSSPPSTSTMEVPSRTTNKPLLQRQRSRTMNDTSSQLMMTKNKNGRHASIDLGGRASSSCSNPEIAFSRRVMVLRQPLGPDGSRGFSR